MLWLGAMVTEMEMRSYLVQLFAASIVVALAFLSLIGAFFNYGWARKVLLHLSWLMAIFWFYACYTEVQAFYQTEYSVFAAAIGSFYIVIALLVYFSEKCPT